MTHCPTCEAEGNPVNFGNCCDECETKRKARIEETRVILKAFGQERTQLGRALQV